MKIAVLFRGPLRPCPDKVIENTSITINELKTAGHDIHTFLVTWPTYKEFQADVLTASNIFNHVILQPEPLEETFREYVNKIRFVSSHSYAYNVWKMYTQSKYAIDTIIQTGSYDRILHSRTDITLRFGNELDKWLEVSKDKYVRPRCDAAWWINDMVGLATPEIMQKAWDWKTLEELGSRINTASIPEEVVMGIMKDADVVSVPGDLAELGLDPSRND